MQGTMLRLLLGLGLGTAGAGGAMAQDQGHHHATGMPTTEAEGQAPPVYDNLGSLHHKITTKSPLAQQYFDQGLRLTYGFNHEEAIRSFAEGARQDSTCAMCFWGIAYARGPNINAPMDTSAAKPAWHAIQRAQALAAGTTPKERDLIAAMAKRYSPDPAAGRLALDSAYAKAMKEVARKYPKDPDAQALYAEALMDLTPWNYWTDRGTKPRPGTLEVVSNLEKTIKRYPNHPGACHFYIHIVEASTTPERALPCSERLAKLMPGAGHLVHMPSHIYMRVGRYHEVVEHNHHAVAEDESFIQDRKPTGFYKYMYYPHNYHMLWAGLIQLGRGAEAIKAARQITAVLPVEVVGQVPPLEYFYPALYWGLARFGKWDELLGEPAPAPQLRYTTGMWRYGRGVAYAAKGKLDDAQAEHDSVAAIAAATPKEAPAGINSQKALLGLAERHLAGRIAAVRGDTAAAVKAYEEAIRVEDELVYDEPPPWYHPVRQELAALHLAAGRPAQAEKLYRADLAYVPNNGWSLYGLARSLEAQKRNREASAADRQYRKSWDKADTKPLAGTM
ncbi:MAG: tetratricopeptide repeat protein [Gemmatimonadales bacterium]